MTKPVTSKHQRLLAIERELHQLKETIPDAIKLRVDNALLVASNYRLVGENASLRRSIQILLKRIELIRVRERATA